jgi:GEVED domain/HYR domain/Lectin C-type domain/Secretion system C-terminal sorting domain
VTATDNCGAQVSVTPASGSVFTVGTTTVNATATDASGNSASCSFTVTVNDDDAPSAVCQNATVTLDANGNATITASVVNNGSSDNCGPVTTAVSQTSFTCANLGPNTVTLTVTDLAGNVSTCSATVTVVDNTNPVITCPANISTIANSGTCDAVVNFTVNATDNCSAQVVVTPASGSVFNVGNTTVTAVATDTSGNSATCTFVVTVTGNGAFTLTGVPNDTTLACGSVIPAAPPTLPCSTGVIIPCDFRTQTQGGWGSNCNGNNPGCYRDANFAAAFPNGLTIGCASNRTLLLTSSAAVNTFLPCGGTPAVLSQSYVNPSCISNVFASQLIAASLSVGFDNANPNYSTSTTSLGSLVVTNGPLTGLTVNQVIAQANSLIGGCGSSYSIGDLNTALTNINQNYVDGTSCGGFLMLPGGGGVCCPSQHHGVSATSACGPCPTITYNEVIIPGNCAGNYTIIRTWTATDSLGNTLSDSQTITIIDNTAPVLVGVPANTTVVCGLPAVPNVTATDACDPSVTVTYNQTITGAGCNQVVTRTWTATDDCGNVSTASQTITVSDNVAPTITCPANPCVAAAPGQCGAPVNFSATATDNCSGVTVTYSIAPGSVFPVGTTAVTATATDACGNTKSCTFNVIVLDNQNPVITCPANITVNAPAGQCSTAVSYNVTATDNCSATVSVSPASGTVFNFGTTTVTATATDPAGNTATCSFTVTVNGSGAATFTGIPANLTLACGAAIPAAPAIVPCGGGNGNGCPTNPVCYNGLTYLGDYNGSRYYRTNNTATWSSANSLAQSVGGQLVTIESSAENNWLASALGNAGNYWLGLNDVATEGTFVWSSGSSATYRNWNAGEPNNYNGNEDYTEFIASSGKWNDQGAPNSCGSLKGIVEFPCTSAPVGVSATSLCGPCPTVTMNQVTVAGNCPGNYTIIRTWTATSNGIVVGTATQTITVVDNTAPTLVGVPSNVTASCGNLPVVPNVTATDACDPSVAVTYNQTITGAGCNQVVTRTWTATDDCGNVATASQTITVSDNVAPVISCPANPCVAAVQGQCGAPVNFSATATDNCSGVTVSYSIAPGSVFPVGTTAVTATATDACGNTKTCTFNVIVLDNQNPVISCPANITVNAPAGQCSTAVSYNVTATDNCSATVSVSPASGSIFGQGTTTVNATATDAAGNTANCSFTVTVNGGAASVAINCPANITTTCEAGGAVVTWQVPTASVTGGCGSSCPTNPVCYNGFSYLGEYNGSRYYITNNAMSWTNAKAAAQNIGGHLVTIETSAENNWLNSLANGAAGHYWIGLNDATTEGSFVWTSGSGATYRNWNTGQPDNYNGNEDYIELITPSGKWNDWPSTSCTQGIVELPCAGGNAGNVTVTQIGGPAPGSVFPAGVTTITYQASNGLGATATCSFTVTVEEVFEVICPGNITIPCTQACGPNGANGGVVSWNQPTVIWESCAQVCQPNTCINGFTYLGEYNGHRYFASNSGTSWSSANSAAQNLGASLMTVNNAGENTWLNNVLTNSNVYWIGLNDAAVEGSFAWSSGAGDTYRSWAAGEPNNGGSGGNQDHTVFNASSGLWFDRAGSDCNAYIIEFDCESYTLTQTSGPANGSFQAPGTYTVSYTATTTTGLTATCSFNVTVQSCPVNYCSASGTTCYEWISQVALCNLNNWSGNNGGYANFTQYSAAVNRGGSYNVTLRPGYAGNSYNETWRVYVDWNQDGDFSDSGELEYTGSGVGVITGSVSVPTTAALGNTRMRVIMRYEQCSAFNGPCGSIGYGEVEDYTIVVSGTNSRIVPIANGTSENDVVSSAASAESAQDGIMGDLTGLRLTKIFPVPTDRDLNLEFLSLIEGKVVIEVMDLNGKVMMETIQDLRSDNNTVKLDVSRLPMATYLVKVSNGKESFTEKFVKQ